MCLDRCAHYPKTKQLVSSEFHRFLFNVLAESCKRKISFKYERSQKKSILSIEYNNCASNVLPDKRVLSSQLSLHDHE